MRTDEWSVLVRDTASSQEEDLVLIERVATGDQVALTGLYERYSSIMLGLGVKLLRRRGEAEDVLHDVFVEAWRKAATYDAARGTVRSWLLLRMRSRSLDRLKSPRLARTVPMDEPIENKLTSDAPEPPKLGTERRALYDAMTSLPEEQRRPLEMVYFAGMTVQEVADRLDVPSGTVKSRMAAARKALRDSLVAEGVAP